MGLCLVFLTGFLVLQKQQLSFEYFKIFVSPVIYNLEIASLMNIQFTNFHRNKGFSLGQKWGNLLAINRRSPEMQWSSLPLINCVFEAASCYQLIFDKKWKCKSVCGKWGLKTSELSNSHSSSAKPYINMLTEPTCQVSQDFWTNKLMNSLLGPDLNIS